MFRRVLSNLLPCFAFALLVAAQAPPAPTPSPDEPPHGTEAPVPLREAAWRERLAEAVRRAASANPLVVDRQASAEAARLRVPQASVLPDLEVELGFKDVPIADLSLSRDNFTMEMVAGRQSFPGRGKRSARRASAEAEAAGAGAVLARTEIDLAADTADAFFRLAEIDLKLAIRHQTRARLGDAAASAVERYTVGMAGQSDVLAANLEKTRLDGRLSTLVAERRMEAARFNALQGLPPATVVPPIESVDPGSDLPAAAELLRLAQEKSPSVEEAAAAIRRAEHQSELARLERRPDWTVMGYFGRRQRFDDFVGVSASINLPWLHRPRLEERLAEKEAEVAASRAGLENVQNQLRSEIEWASADLENQLELARLYRVSILPQAEINERSAREAFGVAKVDFRTFLRAAIDLDEAREEAASHTAGIGRALAALQKASGLPLIAGTPDRGDTHVEE